jgi:hypothetical protein
LHTTPIDAETGCETAIADAGTPETKALFGRPSSLHQSRAATALRMCAD